MTRNPYLSLRIAIAVSLLAFAGFATSVRRYSINDIRDRADVVFMGRVLSSAPLSVMNGRLMATRYTVAVDEVLRGQTGRTTTITYVDADGAPRLVTGTRYVFFKTAEPNDTTVGWGQGVYHFETITTAAGAQTILVSADGEPLVMSNGTLTRGRRIRGADLEPVPEPNDRGAARNADGSPAKPVIRTPKTASAARTYATFDDLKRFVVAAKKRDR